MSGTREEAKQRRHHRSKASGEHQPLGPRLALALSVLGVVYGDIGTSPIYSMRQAFTGVTPVAITPLHMLGVLSLIFWTLIIVISLKYMIFVLRAEQPRRRRHLRADRVVAAVSAAWSESRGIC